MDENKVLFDEGLCTEGDDCLKFSLDEDYSEGFDDLLDDIDDDEFEVYASKKCCDKKKCIMIAAIAGAVIAIAAVVLYAVLKKRNKNKN